MIRRLVQTPENYHLPSNGAKSLVEPPLLVRLQIPSLLLRTLSLSVPIFVWNVLTVRSLLAGAIPRILVWTAWVLLVEGKSGAHLLELAKALRASLETCIPFHSESSLSSARMIQSDPAVA